LPCGGGGSLVERDVAPYPEDCRQGSNCVQNSHACGIPTHGCVTESVFENPGPCGPDSCADAHSGCFKTSEEPAFVEASRQVVLTPRDLAAMHRNLRARALER
jgi:hypothetical protein